jgi:hypothetical protein
MEELEHRDPQTCGQGLAANADLPAKLAELMAVQADVLERHTKALDTTDANAKIEIDAYTSLVMSHRSVAGALKSLAQEMRSYHHLPMATHDVAVMTDPKGQMEPFRRFVAAERDLVALLQAKLAAEEALVP